MIDTAPPRPLREEDVVNFVGSRRKDSLNYHQKVLQETRRRYDLYRGIYAGRFAAYRNSIHIPLLFSIVWADIARKVQISFGSWPVVTFAGYSPEDAPGAKRNEVLVSAQMKDCRSFAKAIDFFACADIYGTAIARTGWSNVTRQHKWREQLMGKTIIRSGDITEFDGPDWDIVDILDFWPQPGKKRVEEMDWVIHRYYQDYDRILEMQQGAYPMYDARGVRMLKERGMTASSESEYFQRANIYRSYSEWTARKSESFAKPVEITEYWGLVPTEFAPDGCRNRVITVANGHTILRNEPNPFWHLQKPFRVFCPMPDPHYFHGTGKVELGEKMQAASNRLVNQKLDALDQFIDPVVLANRNCGLDTQNLYMRPGRVIQVDGPVDDSQIRPLQKDLSGLSMAYNELEALWRYIQQGTGMIEDTVMGGSGPSRETARGYLGRSEQAMTRVSLEARIAEETFIEPLANDFRANNRQFLPVPHMVKILGSAAVTDPMTGLPLPLEATPIDLSDLNPDYRARAVGASRMLGKQARIQNLIAGGQFAMANPVGQQITNWANMFRELYGALDLDPMEMLVTQIPAVNAQAQQMGISPQQVVNGGLNQGGTSLENIEPGMFGGQQAPQQINPMA